VEAAQSAQLTGTNRSTGACSSSTSARVQRQDPCRGPQTLLLSRDNPIAGLVAIARGQTPDPIPNSAVKTLSANGTAPQGAEESVAARPAIPPLSPLPLPSTAQPQSPAIRPVHRHPHLAGDQIIERFVSERRTLPFRPGLTGDRFRHCDCDGPQFSHRRQQICVGIPCGGGDLGESLRSGDKHAVRHPLGPHR
jgi:hypothetical protein